MKVWLCLDVTKTVEAERGCGRAEILEAVESEIEAQLGTIEVDTERGTVYDVAVVGIAGTADELAESVRRRRDNLRGLTR